VCRSEAEVAAILAHEMGHELAGHFRPGSGTKPWLGGMRSSSSGKDEVIGSVHQRIDPEKELEADRISIEILRRAGYDPHAAGTPPSRSPSCSEEGPKHRRPISAAPSACTISTRWWRTCLAAAVRTATPFAVCGKRFNRAWSE